jgi:hypothetical protein
MQWEVSIWNYHKLALLTSLWVFILLSTPVYNFLRRNVCSQMWLAFVVALLVWSFVFIILPMIAGILLSLFI